jgi:hypothetical protein
MKTNLVLSGVVAGSLGVALLMNSGGERPKDPSPPAGIVLPELPAAQEGYFVLDGAAYAVRDGKAIRLTREVSLRITPDGIFGFDGTPVTLPVGHMLANDGRHVRIPAGVTPKGPVPIEPGATDPAVTPPASTPVKPDAVAPPVENRRPIQIPSPTGLVPPSGPRQ